MSGPVKALPRAPRVILDSELVSHEDGDLACIYCGVEGTEQALVVRTEYGRSLLDVHAACVAGLRMRNK